jgi:hypothetical protein
VSAPGPTGQGPSADLKRSEALLRGARAALRRLDTLMSDAQAAQDPVTLLVAEARSNLERSRATRPSTNPPVQRSGTMIACVYRGHGGVGPRAMTRRPVEGRCFG